MTVIIDGKEYDLLVKTKNLDGSTGTVKFKSDKPTRVCFADADPETIHIVQPCHNSFEMTKLSVECIQKYTEIPYKLWVVANFCDKKTNRLLAGLDNVNVIYNHTPVGAFFRPWYRVPYGGSISNGVALELASKVIDGKYLFVMHNDALPVKTEWLSFLKSKIDKKTKIAGVSFDKTRVHAVHQSGFLVDFELVRELNLGFMPRMPQLDVGDNITVGLKQHGYDSYVCKNTFNHPHSVELLTHSPHPSFLREYNRFDRCFNDYGELIYLHFGRGSYPWRDWFAQEKRMSKKQWIHNIRKYYL